MTQEERDMLYRIASLSDPRQVSEQELARLLCRKLSKCINLIDDVMQFLENEKSIILEMAKIDPGETTLEHCKIAYNAITLVQKKLFDGLPPQYWHASNMPDPDELEKRLRERSYH